MTIDNVEEKEERYKFLLSKVDGEISKFKNKLIVLDDKLKEIKEVTKNITHENVPISFSAGSQENAYELLKAHILELENLKNYLNCELEKIASQKKLQKTLQQKYGRNISVDQNPIGGFKIQYRDDDISKITEDTLISKKLVTSLKETIFKK